jgi:hypothetical protein
MEVMEKIKRKRIPLSEVVPGERREDKPLGQYKTGRDYLLALINDRFESKLLRFQAAKALAAGEDRTVKAVKQEKAAAMQMPEFQPAQAPLHARSN